VAAFDRRAGDGGALVVTGILLIIILASVP